MKINTYILGLLAVTGLFSFQSCDDESYDVVGNPDKQAVDEAMATIIDRIIRKKRKGDMSLYKEYQQNDGFKYNLRNLINRMLGDLDYVK